jgi:serine/threonine protein kinase
MDYCAGGSVRNLLDICNTPLNEEQISFVMQGTLKVLTASDCSTHYPHSQGLVYLHSANIIHRDVKAANILLTEDAHVKLGNA